VKVYLAGALPRRDEIRQCADQLIANDVQVTSKWLWANDDPNGMWDNRTLAMRNVNDMLASDLVLVFLDGNEGSKGGHHVEFGFAYGMHALGMARVWVVGEPGNIFHDAVGVRQYPVWAAAFSSVAAEANRED
jgi:nucleoside 2-deoxyribosyltransferase